MKLPSGSELIICSIKEERQQQFKNIANDYNQILDKLIEDRGFLLKELKVISKKQKFRKEFLSLGLISLKKLNKKINNISIDLQYINEIYVELFLNHLSCEELINKIKTDTIYNQ